MCKSEGIKYLSECTLLHSITANKLKVFFNPGPAGSLSVLQQSFMTSQSFESGVLEQRNI